MCINTRWSGGMEGVDDGDSQQVAANDSTSPIQVCEHIRDLTNGDVQIRSESAKHLSHCTIVKFTSAYLRLTTDS